MTAHDDALRERLAVEIVLAEQFTKRGWFHPNADESQRRARAAAEEIATALLPVLADVRAEAAREALRSAADDPTLGAFPRIRQWLLALADRIGGEPEQPFYRDKATGEPCERRGNVLCHSKDKNHLHTWIGGEQR